MRILDLQVHVEHLSKGRSSRVSPFASEHSPVPFDFLIVLEPHTQLICELHSHVQGHFICVVEGLSGGADVLFIGLD